MVLLELSISHQTKIRGNWQQVTAKTSVKLSISIFGIHERPTPLKSIRPKGGPLTKMRDEGPTDVNEEN
jgi:hypothetical protein